MFGASPGDLGVTGSTSGPSVHDPWPLHIEPFWQRWRVPPPWHPRRGAMVKTVAAAAAKCGDRGTIKKKDIVKNPESLAPPKVCLSCVQSSHDVDRDTDPAAQIYVIWSKALLDKKTGARTPSGDECYRCFDTRRRHFGLGFKEMLENRKQSKTLDEKFLELRRARACGDKYKHKSEEDVVDVERFISKDKPQYDDRYESGTFYELWSFAKLRRLPFKAFCDLTRGSASAENPRNTGPEISSPTAFNLDCRDLTGASFYTKESRPQTMSKAKWWRAGNLL